jgi:hypothetical protein
MLEITFRKSTGAQRSALKHSGPKTELGGITDAVAGESSGARVNPKAGSSFRVKLEAVEPFSGKRQGLEKA